jgi:hypothetical protein
MLRHAYEGGLTVNKSAKWLIVAGVFAFWIILDMMFGVWNVRNALRGSILILLLLGLAVVLVDKLIVVFRTHYPPTNPKVAYHAILARSPEGKFTNGYVIGQICEGRKGYSAQLQFGTFADCEAAAQKADELNAQTGLTQGQVNRLISRWA